ncbi:histone H3-like centromeric protein A, partial [Ophiophagus hannah]
MSELPELYALLPGLRAFSKGLEGLAAPWRAVQKPRPGTRAGFILDTRSLPLPTRRCEDPVAEDSPVAPPSRRRRAGGSRRQRRSPEEAAGRERRRRDPKVSTELSFVRGVRDVCLEYTRGVDGTWGIDGAACFADGSCSIELLADAYLCACLAKRATLLPKDIQLTRRHRGLPDDLAGGKFWGYRAAKKHPEKENDFWGFLPSHPFLKPVAFQQGSFCNPQFEPVSCLLKEISFWKLLQLLNWLSFPSSALHYLMPIRFLPGLPNLIPMILCWLGIMDFATFTFRLERGKCEDIQSLAFLLCSAAGEMGWMPPVALCQPKWDAGATRVSPSPVLSGRVLQKAIQAENSCPEAQWVGPLLFPHGPDLSTPQAGSGPRALSLTPLG